MQRTKYLQINQKNINISQLQKRAAFIMAILLVIFIIAQFVVLNFAGIHGPIITKLRAQQQELKLQNDLKRAKISELTKTQDMKKYAQEDLKLIKVKNEVINANKDRKNVTAIDN